MKEVKFRPRTDQHDFDFKMRHITRFLEAGHKVKLSIWFRGREKLHVDLGRQLLNRVIDAIGDAGAVSGVPKFEGRNLSTVVTPKKKLKAKTAEASPASDAGAKENNDD